MLELRHFVHLQELDALIEQLVHDGPGLTVVAGMDPRSGSPDEGGGFLPSGRSTILRILMHSMLEASSSGPAIVVAQDEKAVRIASQLRRRTQVWVVRPPDTYAARITAALRRLPGLLVIDRLCEETAFVAMQAARDGFRVLSQMDTVLRGGAIVRHLRNLGVPDKLFGGLSWVVTVQRLSTLCPTCKQPTLPDPGRVDRLCRQYPALEETVRSTVFLGAPGCSGCSHTGRKGSVMVFDVYRADAGDEQSSLLPLNEYVLRMAAQGHFSLDDVMGLDADQLHRTYSLLAAKERALSEANAALQRKVIELEVSNRVLQRRTEALVSLQDIGQVLTSSTDPGDMARRVCRRVGELCGAERVVLYFRTPDEMAKVLAVQGWEQSIVGSLLEPASVFASDGGLLTDPRPFVQCPPGTPPGVSLRSGLYVPLVAQGRQVGAMVVQSTRNEAFAPADLALLRTFASQAALSMQRAELIEQLRVKISLLEQAQADLAQKERLERELELARQVQESFLPRTFPAVPRYAFAARSRPARQVGGDLYDIIALDADHLGLVIADVADKGLPAALYMALTRSLLLAESRRDLSPRTVLSRVNSLLTELGRPSMFVTVFYGVLDVRSGRLTYARAGHDRPLLLREGTALALAGDGASLGIFGSESLHLSEEHLDLVPGDLLVLYTDGLSDVVAPDGELYDAARLASLLLSNASLEPDAICDAVLADLDAYRAGEEQFDDMTVLLVAVDGAASA